MKINVIRLRSKLHDSNKEMIKENDQFIDELNNELMNDDLLLLENEKDATFSIVFVESGGAETEFLKVFDSLEDPIILLSNGKNNSLPASLEIKTYINQKGKNSLLLVGTEEQINASHKMVMETSEITQAKEEKSFIEKTLGIDMKPKKKKKSSGQSKKKEENK